MEGWYCFFERTWMKVEALCSSFIIKIIKQTIFFITILNTYKYYSNPSHFDQQNNEGFRIILIMNEEDRGQGI